MSICFCTSTQLLHGAARRGAGLRGDAQSVYRGGVPCRCLLALSCLCPRARSWFARVAAPQPVRARRPLTRLAEASPRARGATCSTIATYMKSNTMSLVLPLKSCLQRCLQAPSSALPYGEATPTG